MTFHTPSLEVKFNAYNVRENLQNDVEISGYASIFGAKDQGGDVVVKGAYAKSLENLKAAGRSVKMLWQHDPLKPIGVWDNVYEDDHGLFVKGRVLNDVQIGAEALSLVKAGAIDGLSIGFRTVRADKGANGQRLLREIELWEVSLVTFPMLPTARIAREADLAADLVTMIEQARDTLTH